MFWPVAAVMNTFWRCLGRQVFAITLVLSAVVAKAENIGLRFLVADPGAPVQRQAELARLQAQVTALNGFYRNSSVDLVAEIVEIRFLDYVETDALQVLAAMQSEAGVFAGHFAEAAEVGADYTLMLVSGLTRL